MGVDPLAAVQLALLIGIGAFTCFLSLTLLKRKDENSGSNFERLERSLTKAIVDEIHLLRREQNERAREARTELSQLLDGFRSQVAQDAIRTREEIAQNIALIRLQTGQDATQGREELSHRLEALRNQVSIDATQGRTEGQASFGEMARLLKTELEFARQQFESSSAALRQTVEFHLRQLAQDNGLRLEEMRRTVGEKLEGTLERRLGDSFKLVSERLELVHRGLGEMQTLAVGVGDLKRVMTNVKTRGTWGEIQLGTLLEQVLSPEQFAVNVQTKPDSTGRVEYALKLPGQGQETGTFLWLPIDAKFPLETYHRLVEAQEKADLEAAESEAHQLELFVKSAARDICDKYISPPHTTDFAVMYLPTESLFAEVARRIGIIEYIQRECRVIIAGPTTLAALLNSLQMGFRTLAIQKRSSEVWEILGAVKSEFGKFDDVLKKVEKKLQEAGNVIGNVQTRSRVITKKLRKVQEFPQPEAAVSILSLPEETATGPEDMEA